MLPEAPVQGFSPESRHHGSTVEIELDSDETMGPPVRCTTAKLRAHDPGRAAQRTALHKAGRRTGWRDCGEVFRLRSRVQAGEQATPVYTIPPNLDVDHPLEDRELYSNGWSPTYLKTTLQIKSEDSRYYTAFGCYVNNIPKSA